MNAEEAIDEQPRKRIRLASPEELAIAAIPQDVGKQNGKSEKSLADEDEDTQLQKELKAGITAYVNPDLLGFSGVLKQRYTDFLVNEILPSGQVLHLKNIEYTPKKTDKQATGHKSELPTAGLNASEDSKRNAVASDHPVPEASENKNENRDAKEDGVRTQIADEHRNELIAIFGEKTLTAILKLDAKVSEHPDRKPRDFNSVTSEPIDDKDQRTKAHQAVRRIFSGRLDSNHGDRNTISIGKTARSNNRHGGRWSRNSAGDDRAKGKLGWQELGGEYLHFTLYKENKDTMEVISFVSSQLKTQAKSFQFAGTKDRRAVTVQRVSVYRVQAERLAGLNKNLRGSRLGDFKYESTGLQLGDLFGNEFCLTLRDSHFPGEDGLTLDQRIEHGKKVVSQAVSSFRENGYINYYGLQRFGSFSTGTDEVGTKLLQEDLKGAIDLILNFHPSALAAAKGEIPNTNISSDDRNRALALHIWRTEGNSQKALERMPRKFSAETNIIRHLGTERRGEKIHQNDWQGALSGIQRNLRLMYVHAYQSLVWNVVAGKRWELYGNKVIEGDLVIIGDKDGMNGAAEEVDELGEVIVRPGAGDSAVIDGDFTRARPLTKEEAESGKWDIFDVVLPMPGWDVRYPANAIGEYYKEFMGGEKGGGLDPHNMRRKWKDISLSGGYRKVLARPASIDWEVKTYADENEQLVETDLDRLKRASVFVDDEDSKMTEDGEMKEDREKRIAVILKLQLGSSQYATMALRELMKAGGVKSYKADFGGRGT